MSDEKIPRDPRKFDDANSGPGKDEHHIHQPEFIILDDTGADSDIGGLSHEELEYLKSFHNLNKMHHSFLFRLFMLGVSLVVFIASLILFAAVAGSAVVASLGLFMNNELNNPLVRFWRGFKRLLVSALGLFIAFFSPPLGFSLIIVYFFLLGEPLQEDLVSRVIKTRFTRN